MATRWPEGSLRVASGWPHSFLVPGCSVPRSVGGEGPRTSETPALLLEFYKSVTIVVLAAG